ncbi:MAG: dipeptide epimerase [Planctomycetes bacterium]|nr:dipeptide epimerase [Planctomycetota bacterium]
MKIARVDSWVRRVELTRPYVITQQATAAVDLVVLRLEADDGSVGLGSATPEPAITGETLEASTAALDPAALAWLPGRNVSDHVELARTARAAAASTPGACAALDMALHDLQARHLGVPLVDMLGRVHEALPTSITIGIKPLAETLAEAEEYMARGFRCLKVKIGLSVVEDIERIVRLRERIGDAATIRVDANQGYGIDELLLLLRATADADLELVEQPLPPGGEDTLRGLAASTRMLMAADESLMDERDAATLSLEPRPYGNFVVKLMKCGGIGPALAIAATADAAEVDLMWGCMDESAIGISAALHAAFACRRTRYLDLDGSLDLDGDVAGGGFVLEHGIMRTLDRPGLGVELHDRHPFSSP